MPFEDEIMILEGFEDAVSSVATVSDVMAALTDFPPGMGDSLITEKNKYEDSLLDGFERPPRPRPRRPRRPPRPGPRPRPRPRPRPFFYPRPYIEPSIIIREDPDAVSTTTAANRRRLLAIERKMKELHPNKVRITPSGVEGFGTPVFGATLTKLGAIRRAALKPDSPDAKLIVKNLLNKGKNLRDLAARRRGLAMNALRGYQKNKKTVDKLERVAKSKAGNVLKTALETKGRPTTPDLNRKMNNEIKDARRLRNRAVTAGRRAIQDMKLNSVATILANNADAFGRASIGAARAIAGGNLSNARAFSAEMVKLMQRGKQLKAIRRKQIKRWGSQNKRGRLTRLDARRMRMMKAIAELQRKEESDGLTPAEKTRMRDAQLGLRHVETNMIGITGGSGIPKAARKKLAMEGLGQTDYRMSVKDLQPVFSAKMGPLPKQGEFLSSFGATVIPAVDKRMRKKLARPLNPAGRFLGEDESFVAPSELGPVKFAVPMKPNDPSGQFLTDIMGDLSGNMVEDTSLGFLPMQRTKVPAFSTVKAMPPSMLKMAAESLPARSKRVGNILKRRARTLWNFSRIGANVLRRDKMTRMFEKSKATDVWRDIDLKQREKIEKRRVKRDLERFKRRHGRLPGLGELKPFSIPEAIWQEEKQLDGLGETVSTSSGYKPFSIPEAVWITKGFGDLLLM